MELSEYSTEELRAELSRRYAEKKAADARKPHCRNCKHLMVLTSPYGRPMYRCGARTFVMKGRVHNYIVGPSGHCDKFEIRV